MSNTNHVTLAAIHRYDLGVIICKSCNEVIATLPTDGYKKFYSLCNSSICIDKNKEASQ
ncbi:GapA-binding peptide SR1P [Paenibacillus frigoriresistens]|uniref:GapA-binding peptide SR1P n=1 Tax=Paenibacillus alginolyticus TaxID=59839 RepID=UPI0015652EF2|nr:GapA-binding peptide SR1P [Paenibacillus frigoriresistens]NRF92459.1 GapA-binding peptide SR1P [Paenibacillus frigoriresistens]